MSYFTSKHPYFHKLKASEIKRVKYRQIFCAAVSVYRVFKCFNCFYYQL